MDGYTGSSLKLPVFFSLILLSSAPAAAEVTDFLACLASKGVKNVTYREDDDGTGTYYRLLDFSIQNLRFAEPKVPKPVAIILPASLEQLAGGISCVRAQAASWAVRIRSGGHSYEGLSSVAEDVPFVIVDMMSLNRVSVDPEARTAWVEAGATLGETYHAIAEASDSLGFAAGSCPTVGSGGHIAGGGFGLLSRKYGLAADNVLDAVLVNGEGGILDRESMGDDVFWAIRGGGGGAWGAVYAWKIQLLPVPKRVTSCTVSRPGPSRPVAELVHKWQFVGPRLPDDLYFSAFVGAALPESRTAGISATFKAFYLGPKRKLLSTLKRVFPELAVGEVDCSEMSWIESILYFSELDPGSTLDDLKDRVLHSKGYFKAKSDYIRHPLPLSAIESIVEILAEEPKGHIILDPYGGKMGRISNDSLPFPHRGGNLYSSQYLVSWGEEGEREELLLLRWLAKLYNFMAGFASKGPRAAYVNYLDLDLGVMSCGNGSTVPENAVNVARAWGEKYFLGNYDRLVRAKTKIDPTNAFCNPQSIPPLPWTGLEQI